MTTTPRDLAESAAQALQDAADALEAGDYPTAADRARDAAERANAMATVIDVEHPPSAAAHCPHPPDAQHVHRSASDPTQLVAHCRSCDTERPYTPE